MFLKSKRTLILRFAFHIKIVAGREIQIYKLYFSEHVEFSKMFKWF